MASGIDIDDEGLEVYKDMQLPTKGKARARCLIYKITEDRKNIVLEESIPRWEIEDQEKEYFDIVKKLPPKCGRYIVWDLRLKNAKSGENNDKLVFMSWSPDEAPVTYKMVHAASKENLKKKFKGVMFYVDCTDCNELCNYEEVLSKCTK